MKIGFYIKKPALRGDRRIDDLLSRLAGAGIELYEIHCRKCVREGAEVTAAPVRYRTD